MRDALKMARESGMVYREFEDEFANGNTDGVDIKTLKAFEALVRADERKQIIALANDLYLWDDTERLIKAIKARGNT